MSINAFLGDELGYRVNTAQENVSKLLVVTIYEWKRWKVIRFIFCVMKFVSCMENWTYLLVLIYNKFVTRQWLFVIDTERFIKKLVKFDLVTLHVRES